MNQEKIGQFIRKLREEKDLTQEDVAKKVLHGRDAVSKWERGKNLPDTETLIILSNLFQISINEILAGEKNTSQNIILNLYDNRNKLNRKLKRVIAFTLCITFICITIFLGYYFINQYKSIRAFTITGKTDFFEITNGLFIKTNNKLYFSIGTITSFQDTKIEKMDLYFIEDNVEHIISSRTAGEMLLIDYIGYEEYFNLKKIDSILENLFLKIYYNNENKNVIKLTLTEDYVNDSLIFFDDKKISHKAKNTKYSSDKIVDAIKSKFKKENDNYTYKLIEDDYDKNYVFSSTDNLLFVTYLKGNIIIYEYVYNLTMNSINVIYYEESKLKYSFNFYNDKYQCDYGYCENIENMINNFINILNKILF